MARRLQATQVALVEIETMVANSERQRSEAEGESERLRSALAYVETKRLRTGQRLVWWKLRKRVKRWFSRPDSWTSAPSAEGITRTR